MKNNTKLSRERIKKDLELALLLDNTRKNEGLSALHEMANFCLNNFRAFCDGFPAEKEASEMNCWIEGACFFNANK